MQRIGISEPDIARWERQGRTDVLAKVSELSSWRDPGPCPFVVDVGTTGRRACSIYETRPATCRDYPIAIDHMRFVDCEMLEPGDTDQSVARFMGRTDKAA